MGMLSKNNLIGAAIFTFAIVAGGFVGGVISPLIPSVADPTLATIIGYLVVGVPAYFIFLLLRRRAA